MGSVALSRTVKECEANPAECRQQPPWQCDRRACRYLSILYRRHDAFIFFWLLRRSKQKRKRRNVSNQRQHHSGFLAHDVRLRLSEAILSSALARVPWKVRIIWCTDFPPVCAAAMRTEKANGFKTAERLRVFGINKELHPKY